MVQLFKINQNNISETRNFEVKIQNNSNENDQFKT